MKSALLSFIIVIFAVVGVQAQEVALKAGVVYSNLSATIDESAGFMFGATFIENQLEISADFNYFLDEDLDQFFTPYAFNFNTRYVVAQLAKGKYEIYPMGGVGFSRIHSLEVAMNVGVGSRYELNKKMSIFGDFQYSFGAMDGVFLTIGLQLLP